MLERTMKPFGATAVFLAVINLLTVSSSNINVPDNTSSQTPGAQNSSIALTSIPLISNSPTAQANYQSSPKTGTSPSATAENASTSRSPIISTVSTSTEGIPKPSTSTSLNKDVNDSTVASDTASSTQQGGATTSSNHAFSSNKAITMPSDKSQKPTIINEVTSKEPNTSPSDELQRTSTIISKDSKKPENIIPSGSTEKISATSHKDSKKDENIVPSGSTEQISATSNKGIKIAAGIVGAVIAAIVLVVIYKICQKKPPAAENAEVKESAETKENVKLLSVKSEPNSDMKRTSANQMESIEC